MTHIQFEAPGPGTWQLGDAHLTRPQSRYGAEFVPEAAMEGMNRGYAEYGIPIDIEIALVNRFSYSRRQPIAPPAETAGSPATDASEAAADEFRRRVDRMAETFETKRWRRDLERWDAERKPAFRERNASLQAVEPADLDDEQLITHIEDCRDTLRDGIVLHHRMTPCGLVPYGDYLAHVREWAPEYVMEAMASMDGASPESAGTVDDIQQVAAALNADRAARRLLFSDDPPGTILDRLRSHDGLVGVATDDWLDRVGYRLVSGWDLTEPYGLERPGSLVNTLRTAVEEGVGDAPDHDSSAARETIRSALPAEQRAAFDDRYEEARATYRIRDERSLLDIRTRGLLRRALLEAGGRLADRGRLREPAHVVELEHAELVAALRDGPAPTAADVAAHVDFRETHHVSDAPDRLGSEPSDPPSLEAFPEPAARGMRAVRAVGWARHHASGSLESNDTLIRGYAASKGTFEGRARVVSGPDEFSAIQEGDVLVAEATSSAFNVVLPLLGAIVTDKGGLLSHPAVVAREFGIPGVVGCEDATDRIEDGDRILVDGDEGTVQFVR